GGEVIYSLRNGLQAYALANAAGNVIHVAPIDIVKDPERGGVRNAISCMQCHSAGIRTDARRDEVLATVRLSQNFDAEAIIALSKVYVDEPTLSALYAKDLRRFESALARLGQKPTAPRDEPGARLVARFQEFVRLPQAAEEVGVKPEAILGQFRADAGLRQIAADLQVGGLPRASFIKVYRKVAQGAGLGKLRMPKLALTPKQGDR